MSKKKYISNIQLKLDFEVQKNPYMEKVISKNCESTKCESTKVVFLDNRREIYQRILNRNNK